MVVSSEELEFELWLLGCAQVVGVGAIKALLHLGLDLCFPFSVYLPRRTVLISVKTHALNSVWCGVVY